MGRVYWCEEQCKTYYNGNRSAEAAKVDQALVERAFLAELRYKTQLHEVTRPH